MYDFKQDSNAPTTTISDRIGTGLSMIVRAFGFVLLLIGLWLALNVMSEAWGLYENPVKIEQLAQKVEQGSRIDQSINAIGSDDENTSNTKKNGVRVSYFFAWFIAIIMLLLIGRISLMAVKVGGQLVLYDVQIKRFARELVKESAKGTK